MYIMNNNEIKEFFGQTELAKIIQAYQYAETKAKQDMDFNCFRMISDYYFRENFHGDILYEFLNPEGKHGLGRFFLNHFIEMIKKEKPSCNLGDYSKLEREYGKNRRRIDFVIFDEKERRSIIIENKLYDAVDMDNQLPAYKEAIENDNYTVDAIVYLPLSSNKSPDKSTWSEDISRLLCITPASKLIDLWLQPCLNDLLNENNIPIEIIVILKHYINLLKSLLPNEQKLSTMDNLYNFLKDNKDYFNIVNTLRGMLPKMKNTMFNYIIKSIKRDKCIEGYFRSNELKEIDWGGMPVIQIKNSIENDTYDALLFDINDSEWEEAYWLLFAINSDCRIVDKKDFNNLLATRPDIKILVEEGKFLPEPISQRGGYNQVLRLVAKFDFNQDGAVKDFVIDLINHIISYRKNSNKN